MAPSCHPANNRKAKREKTMAAYQYVFVMKGLGKTYSGGRQVLRDIWLSFLPGAKIGVIGLNGA
jgi:ATPase subunit of ABC transporter with duplicated ATPase domains